MTRLALIALSVALCGALVWLWFVTQSNAALTLENARLSRSVAVLEDSRAQLATARDVARAEAARQRAIADEYNDLRASLLNGDNDVPLPPEFADYINRLIGGL